MKKYRYIFRWNGHQRDITVIGASEGDVYRAAAKIWLPHMAKTDLDDCVQAMRQMGGSVERLGREVDL